MLVLLRVLVPMLVLTLCSRVVSGSQTLYKAHCQEFQRSSRRHAQSGRLLSLRALLLC
jgi:hypothetical protein